MDFVEALMPTAEESCGRATRQAPKAAASIFKAHCHGSALDLAQGGSKPLWAEKKVSSVLQHDAQFLNSRAILVVCVL